MKTATKGDDDPGRDPGIAPENQGLLLGGDGWDDPRFSASQVKALNEIVAKDRSARILGLDHAMRPVVSAVLGQPPTARVYAIMRNGDPTRPNVDADVVFDGLLEPWFVVPQYRGARS